MSDFDFGFTAVDEPDLAPVESTQQTNAQVDLLLDKITQLEAKIISSDNSDMLNEHRALLESDIASKLKDVENLILPLLYNLQKNPEKEYIHWPNRVSIIDKQIEKIKAITRFYENSI
jgi:hypothetical protein